MKKFIILLANSQHYFVHALRIAIFILLTVLGGVNAFSGSANHLALGWGVMMMIIGLMTVLGIWFYKIGLTGGLLIVVASLVTIVFGTMALEKHAYSLHHVSYRLYGNGQLLILLVSGLICASDCAKQIFRQYVLRTGKA